MRFEGGLGMTALTAALVLWFGGSDQGSTPKLPAPTGPFRVGTSTAFLVDSSRTDPVASKRFGGRAIPVQLWYPAASPTTGAVAAYVPDSGLLPALISNQYYGVDSSLLAAWARIDTRAIRDAGIRAGSHPLVTLSPGLGVARINYTSFALELASYGYIVAAIDHPYEGFTVLPGGLIATAGDDSANSSADASVQRRQVATWAADISFVLNRLQGESLTAAANRVAHSIDWRRVGAMGHSSGGLIGVEACGRDPRLVACVNLDGGPLDPHGDAIADFVHDHLKRPTLFLMEQPLYSDADLARRHLTRAEFEARGQGFSALLDSLRQQTRARFYVGKIAGTGHFSFSDAPFVMPTTITRFGGQIIDAQRGWTIITTTIRTFFTQYFEPGTRDAVTSLPAQYPELTFLAQ